MILLETTVTVSVLQRQSRQSARPSKKKLHEEVYIRMLDEILEQRITHECVFSAASLCERFGANLSVVRQVLLKLSHQQVVVLQPKQQARVVRLDVRQARQIFEARRLTEQAVVRLACSHGTSQEIDDLRNLIAGGGAPNDLKQLGPSIRQCGEFHVRLAKMGGNTPLHKFLTSLMPLTFLLIAQYDCTDFGALIWQEHATILDAVEQRDASLAVQLMTHHLNHLELSILKGHDQHFRA